MLPRRRFLMLAAGAAAFAARPRVACAQSYPSRPVRVVVPFAPGGPTDIFARLIVQKLSDQLGKQFYIENVPGASGSIGTAQAAKAAPDGHTILLNVSSFAINPVFFAKVPYDPIREFEPITLAATNDVVIVAHPSVPARTMAELIAQMKGGAKFTFSSGGTGAVTHLLGEQLKQSLGVDLVHVPYNGAGPAIAAVVAGHVPLSISSSPPAMPHIAEGRLRALAVSGKRRSLSLPDVPTMVEAGLYRHERRAMDRRARAGGNAEGDRCAAPARDREGCGKPGSQGALRFARVRAGRQHAGGVRSVHPERDGNVGQGDPRRQPQTGLSTARWAEGDKHTCTESVRP